MTTWYVDGTNGNDSNNGRSLTFAFKTISRTIGIVTPGDSVSIQDGTYSEQILTTINGTLSNPITFFAASGNRGKVIINGGSSPPTLNYTWYNSAQYNVFRKLAATGTGCKKGFVTNVSNVLYDECNAYQIGVTPAGGGGGFIVESSTVLTNVVHSRCLSYRNGPASLTSLWQGFYIDAPGGTGSAQNCSIINCLSIDNSSAGFQVYGFGSNWILENCTAVANQQRGFITGSDIDPSDYVTMNNCIAYGGQYGFVEYNGGTGFLGTHNQFNNCCAFSNSNVGFSMIFATPSNPVNADPLFVNNTGDETGDYHIKSGSPCIDSGYGLNAPVIDYDGNSRPLAYGYDIGCYEWIPPFGTMLVQDVSGNILMALGPVGTGQSFITGKADHSGISDVSEQLYVYDSNNPGLFGPWQYGQMWAGNVDPLTRQGDSVWGAVHEGDLWFNDNPISSGQNHSFGTGATPTFGWDQYFSGINQGWIVWPCSLTGTLITVNIYGAGDDGHTSTIYGCVWSNSASTLLGNGSAINAGGVSGGTGHQKWVALTGLSVAVTSGTTYRIGFTRDTGGNFDWSVWSGNQSPFTGWGYATGSNPGNIGTLGTPAGNGPAGITFIVQTSSSTQVHIAIFRHGQWVTIVT